MGGVWMGLGREFLKERRSFLPEAAQLLWRQSVVAFLALFIVCARSKEELHCNSVHQLRGATNHLRQLRSRLPRALAIFKGLAQFRAMPLQLRLGAAKQL